MTEHLRAPSASTSAMIEFAGQNALLDLSGALWLPSEEVLIVSDLHMEKGTSWAGRGILLPPYDTHQTLLLLRSVVARYSPRTLVFLGDSFHDAGGPGRLSPSVHELLQSLCILQSTFWITGNHDPEIPQWLHGSACAELNLGGLRLTHIPGTSAEGTPEIAGHLHPVASVVGRGRAVRRRCFATDGSRLIMPAFGAYTGGLNVRDGAFKDLFDLKKLIFHVIGERQIFSFPRRMLTG
jgi:uncharacterized protein